MVATPELYPGPGGPPTRLWYDFGLLDDETLTLVSRKVKRLGEALGTRILLENPTVF